MAMPHRHRLQLRFLKGGFVNNYGTQLGGTCSAPLRPLARVVRRQARVGEDLGASLALNIDGEMVVDLWGGWADEARHRAVDRKHHRQCLLHHQDDDRALRAGAGRSRRA